MNTIDKVWTSELNSADAIQSSFDRSTPVRFYDTTLRDGEQTIGVVFPPDEKFEIAGKLSELGVGRIEAGFSPRVGSRLAGGETDPRGRPEIGDLGIFARRARRSGCAH